MNDPMESEFKERVEEMRHQRALHPELDRLALRIGAGGCPPLLGAVDQDNGLVASCSARKPAVGSFLRARSILGPWTKALKLAQSNTQCTG